jgi:hypothetical protein
MSRGFGDKQTIEALVQEVAKVVIVNLIKMAATERWIPCDAYAKLYGLSAQDVRKKTDFLRRIGAAFGEGKYLRYDKFCDPNTGECTIKDVDSIQFQTWTGSLGII